MAMRKKLIQVVAECQPVNGPVILKKRFGESFLAIVIEDQLLVFSVHAGIDIDHENQLIQGNSGPFRRDYAVQITCKNAWKDIAKEVAWANRVGDQYWRREVMKIRLHDAELKSQGDSDEVGRIQTKMLEIQKAEMKLKIVDAGEVLGWLNGVEALLEAQAALRVKVMTM